MAVTAARDALAILERRIERLGPDVARDATAARIVYRRGDEPFAVLRGTPRVVHVGFTRLGRARSTRILDARTAGLPFVRHRVVVEAPGDVDSTLLAWLDESYANAGERAGRT